MNSVNVPIGDGDTRYVTRFAVSIPAAREASCLAAIHNTAQQLECSCSVAPIE
jgi:hypothetical protein